jgi:hypothetical protein
MDLFLGLNTAVPLSWLIINIIWAYSLQSKLLLLLLLLLVVVVVVVVVVLVVVMVVVAGSIAAVAIIVILFCFYVIYLPMFRVKGLADSPTEE